MRVVESTSAPLIAAFCSPRYFKPYQHSKCLIIRLTRIILIVKVSNVLAFPPDFDLGNPLISSLVPALFWSKM
jgi:hypothetical protein